MSANSANMLILYIMTEIATLGEFGLIDHLTEGLKMQNASTLRGVGDDCAVLQYSTDPADNRRVLVTTDMLMEGIHFDLTYTPLKHLGYKAAMVNLSDVYAMNGTPRQLLVSLAVGRRIKLEHVEELYAGIRLACERHGVDIVGATRRPLSRDWPSALLVLVRPRPRISCIAREQRTLICSV